MKKPVPHGLSKEERARWTWRHCDAVCFDVDSTVCRDEAVDELAAFLGKKQEVAAITHQAMNGVLSFRESLTASLDIIRPTLHQMDTFRQQHPPKMTPGIVELVRTLRRKGVRICLVSGGFRSLILPVAALLGVPEENIFANVLHFDCDGGYAGYDSRQPTSDQGGKADVCRALKERHQLQQLVMVGDGATDMEASPPADTFIGFGGNQLREGIRQAAPWFVYSFQTLLDELLMAEAQ